MVHNSWSPGPASVCLFCWARPDPNSKGRNKTSAQNNWQVTVILQFLIVFQHFLDIMPSSYSLTWGYLILPLCMYFGCLKSCSLNKGSIFLSGDFTPSSFNLQTLCLVEMAWGGVVVVVSLIFLIYLGTVYWWPRVC